MASHVSKNVNQLHDNQLTLGQRLADRLAQAVGSWKFIIIFAVIMVTWIVTNNILANKAWDPFPFILLNLVLSTLAAVQAPAIMMSQNRQESKDRIRAEHDYEINLKAELEIEQLHVKLDLLREHQWADLVLMQERQITLLEAQIKTKEVDAVL